MTDDVKLPTAEELGNTHGLLCPKCHKGTSLYISAFISAKLTPLGADTTSSDVEWDKDSPAGCNACDWDGTVRELEEVDVADA